MCVCPRELIRASKCSLVKKDGGRYNKPSLIHNISNKKLVHTVSSSNIDADIHHSRKHPLLNWNVRKRSGETPYRNEQVTALWLYWRLHRTNTKTMSTTNSTNLHSLLRAECTKLKNLLHNSAYIGIDSAIRYTMLLDVSAGKPHTRRICYTNGIIGNYVYHYQANTLYANQLIISAIETD